MFKCPLCLNETVHEIRKDFQLSEDGTHYSICSQCHELIVRLRRNEQILPPKRCSECDGRLNIYVGSHTSIRNETLSNGVKWLCVKCFEDKAM